MESYEKPVVIKKVYSYYGLVDAGCCFRSCGGSPAISPRISEKRGSNLIEEKLQSILKDCLSFNNDKKKVLNY